MRVVESRREQILATAADLFAARGFHGVSVAELGAACGISGPALYKHFPSKQAMLAEMLTSISEQLLAVGRERVAAAGGDPAAALRGLVDWHGEFATTQRPLIVVQDRVWASLPDDAWSFVHLDVTLFEPTLAALEYFHPRLSPGGVILCDGSIFCPGAETAFREYCERNALGYAVLGHREYVLAKEAR